MIYITLKEIHKRTSKNIVEQLTYNDAENLDDLERQALAIMTDKLGKMYDIEVETSKTGIERNEVFVRHTCSVLVYYMFESSEDDEIPNTIINAYKEAQTYIKDLVNGKTDTQLIKKTGDNGKKKSTRRWGKRVNAKRD